MFFVMKTVKISTLKRLVKAILKSNKTYEEVLEFLGTDIGEEDE